MSSPSSKSALAALIATPPRVTDAGLLILRVGLGGFMAIGHGLGKLKANPATFPDPIGIGNQLSYYGAVGSELVGGLLLVIGLLTRLAAIPLLFTMLVAALLVHRADPIFLGGGAAKEPALIYALGYAAVLLLGPGRWSLDHVLFARR